MSETTVGVVRKDGLMTDVPVVTGRIKDLTNLDLGGLPSFADPALAAMLDRVMGRLDKPGTAISGYNGAGGDPDSDAAAAGVTVVDLPAGDAGQ